MLLPLAAALAGPQEATARIVRELRVAAHGNAASNAAALMIDGRKHSVGLVGSYRELVDLRTGRYRWSARYLPFANAEGVVDMAAGAKTFPERHIGSIPPKRGPSQSPRRIFPDGDT